MKLIDNINELLGDDIKQSIKPGARLKIGMDGTVIADHSQVKSLLDLARTRLQRPR